MADTTDTTRREAPLTKGMFDVGKTTKEIQQSFKIFGKLPPSVTNNATPEGLAVLLDDLAKLTDAIVEQRNNLALTYAEILLPSPIGAVHPDGGVAHWDGNMKKWRARLDEYRRRVRLAKPGDRNAVLWDVTNPLLVGYYGGRGSKLPQGTLDAFTPFALSNALNVAEAWREERWELFQADLAEGLANLPADVAALVPWWVWGIAGLAGAAFVVSIARGRR